MALRRPTSGQTGWSATVLAMAGVVGQYFVIVQPEARRADSNKMSNYQCRDDLKAEKAEVQEWIDRYFVLDCNINMNCP